MTLPWTPVILSDGLGSIIALALAVVAFVISYHWYQRRLWDLFRHYLFFFTLSLVVFALSRSGGHLVKQILILGGHREIWHDLAPYTGALNTMTFVVIFAVSIYSRRIGLAHREIVSYQHDLENLVERRTRLLAEQLHFQKELLDSVPIPIFFTDTQGLFLGTNEAFNAMFNCRPDKVMGRLPEEVPELRRALPFLDLCIKEQAGESGMIKREEEVDCAGGEKRFLSLYATPFSKQESGEEEGYIGVIIDMSERKFLEAQMIQTEKLETVATMAGGISHEFNNILAAIMGFTELALHKTTPGGELAYDLEQILSSSRRARDLVKQMLIFSRQKSLNQAPCDLGEIIENAAALLRHRLKKGIEIELELHPEPTTILADQGQIQQALLNLGSNGIKAMAESGGRLLIKSGIVRLPSPSFPAAANLPKGEYVTVQVKDQGTGMDSRVMQRIFDPFFSTRDTGDGSGLGLSVVHGIIKNHGGMIRVESSPGHGTSFDILLPLAKKRENEPTGKAAIHPGEGKAGEILLVDDEESVAEMLATMIRRLGFPVRPFNDPQEALSSFMAEPEKYGLAILDQIMPAMSGSELGLIIKEKRPEIPIIICSGFSEETENRPEHVALWLTKPVPLKEVKDTLNRFLGDPPGQVRQ